MILVYTEYAVRLVFLFALGAVLGSHLSVWIHRLPQQDEFWRGLRSLVHPPSRCPGCFRAIRPWDNIPIFGWLKLGGRCRFCKYKIPARYPLLELLTAVLFVVVYACEVPVDWYAGPQQSVLWHDFGPLGDSSSRWFTPMAMLHWRYAFHMVLVLALVVATFIDFDFQIIPDTVTLPAMVVGVLGNWLLGNVYIIPVWFRTPGVLSYQDLWRLLFERSIPQSSLPDWFAAVLTFTGVPGWVRAHPHLHGLALSVAGIIIGGGVVWVVRVIGFRVLKREAMGFGDVVLMAMIGSFIGWQATLIVFFLAPVCALGVAIVTWLIRRDREMPYGPYLSLATLAVILGWKWIWPVAERQIFALGPFLPVAACVMVVCLAGLLWLSRRVQELLGIYPDFDEPLGEWTPGDQLAWLAGASPDRQAGKWRDGAGEQWPGTQSGRGLGHQQGWHRPGTHSGHAWQRNWQRCASRR